MSPGSSIKCTALVMAVAGLTRCGRADAGPALLNHIVAGRIAVNDARSSTFDMAARNAFGLHAVAAPPR